MVLFRRNDSFEKRVLLTPDTIKKFIQLGFKVNIENNFGSFLNIKDEDFKSIGANCLKRNEILGSSDILLKINCPTFEEITLLKENTILIGNFFPHLNKEIINKLINKKVKISFFRTSSKNYESSVYGYFIFAS